MSKPDFEAMADEIYQKIGCEFDPYGWYSGIGVEFKDIGVNFKDSVLKACLEKAYRMGQLSRVEWPSAPEIERARWENIQKVVSGKSKSNTWDDAINWLRSRVEGEK